MTSLREFLPFPLYSAMTTDAAAFNRGLARNPAYPRHLLKQVRGASLSLERLLQYPIIPLSVEAWLGAVAAGEEVESRILGMPGEMAVPDERKAEFLIAQSRLPQISTLYHSSVRQFMDDNSRNGFWDEFHRSLYLEGVIETVLRTLCAEIRRSRDLMQRISDSQMSVEEYLQLSDDESIYIGSVDTLVEIAYTLAMRAINTPTPIIGEPEIGEMEVCIEDLGSWFDHLRLSVQEVRNRSVEV